MLTQMSRPRENRARLRWIKLSLREAMGLLADDVLTVAELTCLEVGCAPKETAIGLLRSDGSQVQHKFHKPLSELTKEDLCGVCRAWGIEPRCQMKPFQKEPT